MNKKEQKLMAFVIMSIFFLLLLVMLYQFFIPIILGFILAFLSYPLYMKIYKKSDNKIFSSLSVMIILILILIIPLSIIGGVVVNQIMSADINLERFEYYEHSIRDITGVELSLSEVIDSLRVSLVENLQEYSQVFISTTMTFLVGLIIAFFVFYYALINKELFLATFYSLLPFNKMNSVYLVEQSGYAIKALLIGQVLTAVVQGLLGMFSFFVVGVQGAFFWGIVMIILSLIPVVGAFLVWLPAGVFLIIEGNIFAGIFVLAWGALVVSQIDNIIRPKLVNRYFKLHPLLIFLGVFGGLSLFGMIGLIIGPLLFALFILFFEIYQKEYGDSLEEIEKELSREGLSP